MLKEIAPGKTNKNLCLVIFVNSQEPDQGQPCLHKKFRLSFKQAAKKTSVNYPQSMRRFECITTTYILSENKNRNVKKNSTEICRFYSFKITVCCIGVFAYVDNIIGKKVI